MKDLLEKMTFAGEPEQKPGDQVRGTDKVKTVKRTVPYQKHPLQGKLVGAGAAEESVEHIADQLRKELEEYGALGSGISSGSSTDRTEYAQMRRDQKAQQQQADSQEDDIENQIKGLTQQSVAVSNQSVPPPNPNDPASVAQFAAASRQKRAEKQALGQQKTTLAAQLAKITPYSE
jgi:hypothetical protein